MTIKHKKVLVTGANRGIGIALPDDLTDPAMLEGHLAVNLFGTFAVTWAFLPALTRSRGVIVNILSMNALAPLPLIIPAYSVSKAAAFSLTQSLRALVAGQGVSLRRGRQRRGGDLPRSRLGAHGCPLAR